MKLTKFSKVLMVLCLALFVVGGIATMRSFDTKLIAGIDGGVMESVGPVGPIIF